MDIFLATQPIFDTNNNIFGYEILYRENEQNAYAAGIDGDVASGSALVRSFLDFGLSTLTNNTRAFVNFTSGFIENEVATLFSKEQLVIEILETVTITPEILEACQKLKELGYLVAIDDFSYQQGYDELIRLADIIKVDFRQSSVQEQEDIVRKYRRPGLRFLAEKVETREEHDRATKQGYHYFQGYFYAKPTMNHAKKLSSYNQSWIQLMEMLNAPEPDFQKIAEVIEGDLALSYQLLRLVNSAYYAFKQAISSISLAISALGLEELRKWIYVLFISDLKQDRPDELVRASMFRGKFMENMAVETGHSSEKGTMMTVGMFSLLDVLMDCPMSEAIQDMHFPAAIADVLQGTARDSFLGHCYEITLCYGRGHWQDAIQKAQPLGITSQMLQESFLGAIKWVKAHFGI